uniref:Methyltransferase domain-containing protein n=1 Tax=Candidatus Kentrum sp. MB TaxID=2138164 RepID=A0A450XP60_9GAMM|nr:MAG: Methyltransferase domain-containing protein [Candidatus Kentron sp. MB]VFK35415.1 MAG: Methyltransferase domain-containing protein [Candidatus Kentron sp. MB]VFK77278.1 MAG: Methyltransferase domain-containing protein [Candidatus Kentron sp. MB]
MENPSHEQVMAGQADYTGFALHFYDFLVYRITTPFFWKCTPQRLVSLYNRHVTTNHLDVGIGSGYLLDRCDFPSQTPRIALMDLNPNTLTFVSKRIARYNPETYLQNVLEPVSADIRKFDSIGMNYLLHCVPGTITSKSVAFDHLKALMNPGAVLFGSTLLQKGVPLTRQAKLLLAYANKRGSFSNQEDSLEDLERALHDRFKDVSLEIVGCAAIFSGRV